MFQELHRGQAPAVTYTSADRFPTITMDFKEVPVELDDWNTWPMVYQVLLCALKCADALISKDYDDFKIGGSGLDDSDVGPEKLRAAY